MRIPRWLSAPWRKQTDLNTVTPISTALRLQSSFGWIVEAFGGSWQRNIAVESTQNLLAFSAVYACIQIISADISKLRIKLLRLSKDPGIWDEVITNSPFLPVLRKPNRFQTRIQFLSYWLISKLIYGNAYILLGRDNRGVVNAMYPLDSRGVTPLVASDGSVFYKVSRDYLRGLTDDTLIFPASEIIHDRMMGIWHPLVGVSPLYSCGSSATQGIRIQNNSEAFFKNMSRPSGQLTAPGKIDDVVAERLKREFEKGFSGDNIGRIFVSGNDLKFESFTMPPEQAQLIEQQRWTVEDVARAFTVPLYKIQAGTAPSFTNVTALNQEYYQQTLQTHIEAIEVLIDEALGLDNSMGTELDLEGLFRMDPVSRAEVTFKRIQSGSLAPNEARAIENLHPVEGGDSPMIQQQNFSLSALAKRDAKPDPFATGTPTPTTPPDTPAKEVIVHLTPLRAKQLDEALAEELA